MKYYQFVQREKEDIGLYDLCYNKDIILSTKTRKLLEEYVNTDPEGQEDNKFKLFFHYEDPQIPWYGEEIGELITKDVLPGIECPKCSTVVDEGRLLPFSLPSKFSIKRLFDRASSSEQPQLNSLEAFHKCFNKLEKLLNMELLPYDVFSPIVWSEPVLQRNKSLYGFIGEGLVVDEKGKDIISSSIPNLSFNFASLEIKSSFFSKRDIDSSYFFFASPLGWHAYSPFWCELSCNKVASCKNSWGDDEGEVERKCREYMWDYCDECGFYSIKQLEGHDEETLRLKSKRKATNSRWFRKRQLPKGMIVDSPMFRCPIYSGMIVTSELKDCLEQISDLQDFKINELSVVDG